MLAYIQSRYDQFIQDLETVVNIDSGSNDGAGIMKVASFFENRFDRLGMQTKIHAFDNGRAPCLEVVDSNGSHAPFDFLLLGHMDTVFAAGTAAQRPFRIDGARALGPGVCDMKGGLVTVLHAMETAHHFGLTERLSICIGFNGDEEIGSHASRPWYEPLAQNSKRVLVFEPCRATGHRVIERKGGGGYEVICHGKAAHAGAEPDKGANAVMELAHQILEIGQAAQPDIGTTVNVTTVCGGTADNVIPEYAQAVVDVRFSTVAESRRIQSFFADLPQHTHVDGVRVEIKGEISRPPMAPSDPQRRLWQAIAAIGQGLGLEMKLIATGGCSDGNYTAALGIPTIDAMGPQGGDAHNSNEYVELNSVTPNIHLICQILAAAAEGNLP